MLDCWSHFPEDRPSFTHLRETLTEMNKEPNAYVNFYSVDRVMLPPTNEDIAGKIYHIMTNRSIKCFFAERGVCSWHNFEVNFLKYYHSFFFQMISFQGLADVRKVGFPKIGGSTKSLQQRIAKLYHSKTVSDIEGYL